MKPALLLFAPKLQCPLAADFVAWFVNRCHLMISVGPSNDFTLLIDWICLHGVFNSGP